jgi:Tol biopolymer transport system component
LHPRLQRLVRRLTRLVAAGAVAVAANATVADATFPGRNGRIAMAFDGGCGIAVMKPDGTAFRRLTECGAFSPSTYAPDWSPDGRRLLLLMDGRPAIMGADGSRLHHVPLATEPRSESKPSFAPDGRRFAYTGSTESGRSAIWVAAIDGTADRRLRAGMNPSWSPNGRTIAFRSLSRGAFAGAFWAMNARTGKRIRWLAPDVGGVDWSPDGRRLVYSATGPAFNRDLFVVRADGHRKPRRLTRRNDHEDRAVWSPDGRQVAFVRWESGEGDTVQYSIWTKNLRDGAQTRIYESSPILVEEDLGPLNLSWQARPR